MKTKIAYILIFLGAAALVGQMLYRMQREKEILQIQIQSQQATLVKGLKSEWKKFLWEKVKQNPKIDSYRLLWNRKGSELRGIFFPLKESKLNWKAYRKFVKNNQTDKIKKFLQSALQRNDSWDRVLAITEWKRRFNTAPKLNTKYEESLIELEAKKAYHLIFAQFSKNYDFTFASAEVNFDQVFYRVQQDGSIEAFVPKIAAVQKSILPQFKKLHNLSVIKMDNSPWEISLLQQNSLEAQKSIFELFWLILALTSLLIGVSIYFAGLRDTKKALLKRVSFLNQVVHELKTPLTGLKLHLQLIRRGNSNENNLQALDTSLDRLNRLFDDVVLMNRPFEQVETKKISKQKLNEMLQEFSNEFNQLEVATQFSEDVFSDQKRLRVVFRNLIKNGIRYGKKVSIDITSKEDKTIISFSDEGPGISHKDSPKIFQEFYRSESAKKINTDGLGLGLHLVKKMCSEMNATIELNNPGQAGAIFQLSLEGKQKK